MKPENIFLSLLGSIVRVGLVVGIIYVIYNGALISYDYGYRILREPPVSPGEGREVTILYTEGMSPLDLGDMMEKRGLSRDGKLFALQYLFSEYRKDLKPGSYKVSTSMTAEEILAVMAEATGDEKGEQAGVN